MWQNVTIAALFFTLGLSCGFVGAAFLGYLFNRARLSKASELAELRRRAETQSAEGTIPYETIRRHFLGPR